MVLLLNAVACLLGLARRIPGSLLLFHCPHADHVAVTVTRPCPFTLQHRIRLMYSVARTLVDTSRRLVLILLHVCLLLGLGASLLLYLRLLAGAFALEPLLGLLLDASLLLHPQCLEQLRLQHLLKHCLLLQPGLLIGSLARTLTRLCRRQGNNQYQQHQR